MDLSEVTRPNGIVYSRFKDPVHMPIQTAGSPDEVGFIEVFPEFEPGLRDIEGFEYLWLITRLHLVSVEKLEVVPFLDNKTHGVFATRAPTRPNRLGLSLVQLTKREGGTLHFAGNDMADGTPVLDIKPYVPKFDGRKTDRIGWFEPMLNNLQNTFSDRRMQT